MKATAYRLIVVLFSLALLLSACQSASPQPTLVPTIALETAAPETGETPPPMDGYPAPEDGYPGPMAVPAVDNLSRVTAELVEQAPDEANAGWARLTARIISSEPVDGMPSMTDERVNQQIDLYAQQPTLPELAPGDTFTALVRFEGDEQGGRFYAAEVYQGEGYP